VGAPSAAEAAAAPMAEPERQEASTAMDLRIAERDDAPADELSRHKDVAVDHAFGAEVWLSNDDSMSLASAQRVLYAVMNHLPIELSQIRPHELLNYFSFDTTDPVAGDPFGVQAAAATSCPSRSP
jgi:hypothetical protein